MKFPQNIDIKKASWIGSLIAMGIVFGDIGTSPLYVMQAIIGNLKVVDDFFIYGAVSCIIWTLTLQTTVKYVIIALRNNNHGEGGVFALYALVRNYKKWAYILAIIGSGALLADGIITPSITITSSIEGLQRITPDITVTPIVLLILVALFVVQQFGTSRIGGIFGPLMLLWFGMLSFFGIKGILMEPGIFKAFNPYYAFEIIKNYPGILVLMGAVFLATTGAEALYSDLGHCGAGNIRRAWIFVKTALILNYLGQGAYVLTHRTGTTFPATENPFFSLMPSWFVLIGVIIATIAAVIASQAMITGAFTLVAEAIQLKFFPKLKMIYPSSNKGQVYIPAVNLFLWIGCSFVVLYFGTANKMQAAYGLAITFSMLITTTMLTILFLKQKRKMVWILLFALVFFTVEGTFLTANLGKIPAGGWVTLLLTLVFGAIMFCYFNGSKIKARFIHLVKLKDNKDLILDIRNDKSIELCAANLVYITQNNNSELIEQRCLYSIAERYPKRADTYWFLSVNVLDTPNTFEYEVFTIEPQAIIKVNINIGFKVGNHISDYFAKIIDDLAASGEITLTSPYESVAKHDIKANFKYVITDKLFHNYSKFSFTERLTLIGFQFVQKLGITDNASYELSGSDYIIEYVPITTTSPEQYSDLKRITHT